MTIYILMIFAILILGLFTSVIFQSNKSKKIYAIIVFLLVYAISALRSTSVGTDVPGYVRYFFTVENMAFQIYFCIVLSQGTQCLISYCPCLLTMNKCF